jgi:DNA-directed RNA polymerase beta subunit
MNNENSMTIKVNIRQTRRPELGDKLVALNQIDLL